ncbi:collagen alpha-1(I) chain-like [Grus japonensis]|uniref:Collagen alpha-1(I) chain-like n=1 Tax=Grus japonensis TaxID=30415 RepID=A0ABC9YEY1_GRUJA
MADSPVQAVPPPVSNGTSHWVRTREPVAIRGPELLKVTEEDLYLKEGFDPIGRKSVGHPGLEEDPVQTEPEIPQETENTVVPLVWASGTPGRLQAAEPVKIRLKPGAKPVRQKQYP